MKGSGAMGSKVPLALMACLHLLSACTVNVFAQEYEVKDYPLAWSPLVTVAEGGCSDITGGYVAQDGLSSIVQTILGDPQRYAVFRDATEIRFRYSGNGSIEITGKNATDILFSENIGFRCDNGLVSIVINTDFLFGGAYGAGQSTESVNFGKTESHELVAELSEEAIVFIAYALPVISAENRWLKFQPTLDENVAQPDAMFLLGRESPFGSKRQFVWFCRAAHNDHSTAQFLLASRFYEEAEDQSFQTRRNAYLWYSLAARSGDSVTSARRDEARNKMNPSEIIEAENFVRSWAPAPIICEEEANNF